VTSVDDASKVGTELRVGGPESFDDFDGFFEEFVVLVLVYEGVVGSDAGLSRVDEFSPDYTW